ncbi:MAG: hypothetical protein JWP91_3328 [Fibrobacteres bacterium]|nr:hypothetical protein [Fibrobacterota bacterium]
MKTSTQVNNTRKLLAAMAAGALIFSGCFRDESPTTGDSSGEMTATIEGRVQGDTQVGGLGKGTSLGGGVEGATVTVLRLQSDGSFETVSSAGVKTDVQGRFSIKATVDGVRELVVKAGKEGKEWKAVVSGKVKKGSKTFCRPVNIESTVEADVLARIRAESQGTEISFADVASHIDADLSVKANGKADVESYLSAQIKTEAKARTSVLVSSVGKSTLAQIDQANEARMDAEAKLEADLEAAAAAASAGSTDISAEAKAKIESDWHTAGFKAWTESGIALGELAKACEASYRVSVGTGANATVDASAKLAWMHRLALENAATLEAAVKEDVKASGGQSGTSDIAVTAGAALKASLNNAKTGAEIDSAFSAFRASVSLGLKAYMETALGGKVLLSDSSAARMALKTSLETAVTADQIAEAYRKFYVSAEAEIKAKIAGSIGTADSAKVDALTRTALLIGIQGNGGGTVVLPGFSLSGKVDGNVSGATVQVATVKADGSLEILPNVSGTTDAQGGFTLNTDAKLPDSAVLVVTKNDSRLMVLIDSATAKPVQVGTESTVEARIYQQIIKDGNTSMVTRDEIKAHVDSGVAASVNGDDSAIVHLMAGLEIAAKAQNRFLMDSGFGITSNGISLIASARASAQTKLEADLKASAGAAASVQASYDAYHKTMVDAYVQAGLDAQAYARSQQVYAQALARFTVGLTAEAKLSLVRSAHVQAARALRAGAEAQVKASGANEATLKTLAEAGVALQASIQAAVSAEAITGAYESYHASVIASLKTALVLHATVIENLDAKIHGKDGARAQLMSKLQAAADADAAAKAHVEFSASVEAQVTAAFGGGLGAPSAAQVKAVSQAMALANMCG